MAHGENKSERGNERFPVETLLAWYDTARRDLPWRAPPGAASDPYRVWLSEIMLQQTTVKAVAPYYAKFLHAWPTVEALAETDLDDVLKAWAGLGYYARARNLHACARRVASEHRGCFPGTEKELLTLPGVGAYTAAAIASIAFGQRAAVVDGNVERVLARYFSVETPLPAAKKDLKKIAEQVAPSKRPGDFAQAMMDLGATICTPRTPSCALCPVHRECAARARGLEAILPYRATKPAKPLRCGVAFLASRADGAVLLRKRVKEGLLGGMTEVPGTPWVEEPEGDANLLDHAPLEGPWAQLPGTVRHTFTHFHLELSVFSAAFSNGAEVLETARPEACMWVPRHALDAQALPSVMRKVVAHVLDDDRK